MLDPRASEEWDLRDNHEGMPEIIAAYERDGLYFGVIRVETPQEGATFEFGVERTGHLALQRILESRPFGSMPGLKRRFYFAGDYGRKKLDQEPVTIGIRVEEDKNSKKLQFDCPASLASNLKWFFEMRDLSAASALRRVSA
jgi:hypothetical protein